MLKRTSLSERLLAYQDVSKQDCKLFKKVALLHLMLYTATFPVSVIILFHQTHRKSVDYLHELAHKNHGGDVVRVIFISAFALSLPMVYMNVQEHSPCLNHRWSEIAANLLTLELPEKEMLFCSPLSLLVVPVGGLFALIGYLGSYVLDLVTKFATGSTTHSLGVLGRRFAKIYTLGLARGSLDTLKYMLNMQYLWFTLAVYVLLMAEFLALAIFMRNPVTVIVGYACVKVMISVVSVVLQRSPTQMRITDALLGLDNNSTLGGMIRRYTWSSSSTLHLTTLEMKELEKFPVLDALVEFMDRIMLEANSENIKPEDWHELRLLQDYYVTRDKQQLFLRKTKRGIWSLGGMSLQSWESMIVRVVFLVDEDRFIAPMS